MGRPVAADRSCVNAPSVITSPQKAQRIVEHIPTQLCSTSHQSNPPMKFRRKLTEAEKQERKLRHIMANRESARQTIRRRQAMHLELTRKAAEMLEENEYLKKQKKLMMEAFNSVKGRNEFLKTQLAEAKKVAAGETEEEPDLSEPDKSCSATASTSMFMQNQPPPPSVVPCFWPPIVPSSGVIPFQCASHLHSMSSSQFPMAPGDTTCLHTAQEQHSMATPLFVVPVPWLLPFRTQSSTSRSSTHCRGNCSCSDTRPSEDNNYLSSKQNTRAEINNPMKTTCASSDRRAGTTSLPLNSGAQSCLRQPPTTLVVPGLFTPMQHLENVEPPRTCQVHDTPPTDLRLASTHDSGRNSSSRANRKKAEDMAVAMEARRRRKELMRLKNVNCK